MKLPFQQLEQHLTKNLAQLYIVSGDEVLLVQEAMDLIRAAAAKVGFAERIRVSAEGSDWGNTLFSHTQSLSLFSTKRILELDLTNIKLNATTSKTLQEVAEQLTSDTLLLIRIHKIDSKVEKSAWFQALDKKGAAIAIWPIPIEQLPQWIMQRAKKIKLTITKPAADMLAALVEGNLLAASQEIEKLCLLQTNSDTIDVQTVEQAVADHAHFDIFTLVESALSGNHKRSIRILDNLHAEDAEPVLVLWALTREIRTLADIAKQVKQGATLSSLFAKFRIWEKRQAGVRAFLQRHSQQNCWNLLIDAAQIDRLIKGADKGNVWNEMQNLLLKM